MTRQLTNGANYMRTALYVLLACAVLSLATSYLTYQYRSHRTGVIGQLAYYDDSNTFVTPNDVFEPYSALDVQSGIQTSGTNLDYGALLKNILLLFIPLGAVALLREYALERNPNNVRMVMAASISGLVCFVLGAALTYSFYITPLRQQQAYANGLFVRNQQLRQELKVK